MPETPSKRPLNHWWGAADHGHMSYRGLMAPATAPVPGPGLMAAPSQPLRGLMEFHPGAAPLEWSRDGVAFLWLIAMILALVLSVALLGTGFGRQ